MKRRCIAVLFCVAVLASSCGGSSGGGETGAEALEAAFQSFGTIMDSCEPAAAQVVGEELPPAFPGVYVLTGKKSFGTDKATVACSCPGGGSASLDSDTITLTTASCTSSDGLVYTGTATMNGEGTIDATFTTFGGCTNGTATGLATDGCGGSIAGTCGGATVTCTISDPPEGEDECVLTCT